MGALRDVAALFEAVGRGLLEHAEQDIERQKREGRLMDEEDEAS